MYTIIYIDSKGFFNPALENVTTSETFSCIVTNAIGQQQICRPYKSEAA